MRKIARKKWSRFDAFWFTVFWRYYWGSPLEKKTPLITRESIASFFGDY